MKYFRVVKEGMVIYTQPTVNATKLKEKLKSGSIIEVDGNSRRERDGYVWWRHGDGWVIERAAQAKVKALQVNLREIPAEAMVGAGRLTAVSPEAPKPNIRFRVIWQGGGGINIRRRPAQNGKIIGELRFQEEVECFPDSRREVGGIVWWQHARGWSAERPVEMAENAPNAFMMRVGRDTPPRDTPPQDTPPNEKVRFRALTEMNVRRDPGTEAGEKNVVGDILAGTIIEAYPDSRTVNPADGLVWWRHDNGRRKNFPDEMVSGWTAERGLDPGTPIYLEPAPITPPGIFRHFMQDAGDPININDDTILPGRDTLFRRLPVAIGKWKWVQHFGNTSFAESLTGTSYEYSCYLHGGLDLGNGFLTDWNNPEHRVPVLAGVSGKVLKPGGSYNPGRVWVEVKMGKVTYRICYGHLHPDTLVSEGDSVGPDTVVGFLATKDVLDEHGLGFDPHLHLEVRRLWGDKQLILNPLLFMPDEFRNPVVASQPTDLRGRPHFCAYHKWQSPFDQPVIVLSGGVMGPKA